ncbi:alpha-1,4-glucan--maltose-1-phosphate maltosyltransferase [Xenophilus arseniciresistens]|uniref:Alpha-1,4-glucan:maltose-1-phosphate maltosyltransferase n=1 Tax=Xenophilus arseniciresistens TaxID=1283306 RepID=A0AAE3N3M1_9BURK|nr:alpha-1,4-glucan--maltose-1-phosphate maltosyltransferase [Xenophilus arseniciresistens]MDA7415170.1 alpha-1,4-glucan--maltose-1-phosphate maltosyltransferase [Xenophilus arseniciresistens]
MVPIGVADGRQRAVIDAVLPSVDSGRFAAKCVAGEPFAVQANCFAEGHDVLRVMLQWRRDDDERMHEVPMALKWNDEWHASFTPPTPGRYHYTVCAWVDALASWHHELVRRVDAQDIRIAARVGAAEIAAAASRASAANAADARQLRDWAQSLERGAADSALDSAELKARALDPALTQIAQRYPDRQHASTLAPGFPLVADRERARFSTWYELFPRSAGQQPGRHGTFADVQAQLPRIQRMGFDVLYFPPIHPIGREQRKGRNNALSTEEGDVGSPWAIGAAEGGHKDILPELGTHEQFRALVQAARAHGMEIALDIAFQCAPDHPYVKEHPAWFKWRPDGTVQYAENPPKKYQDIYPFNFETEDWPAMWAELKSVLDHWIAQGVAVFRVDNPHTKAFPFWEWAITEVKRRHPEVIFLAEAFTRPKVMHRLAKLGFTQSYTYFTWRNSKKELTEYFTELSTSPGLDYFRPNVWPNTPDILHESLQNGSPAQFKARLVLAATLSASYGIYGPAYELLEHLPRNPGSEEYLDSEKYQLRHWQLDAPHSLEGFIAHVNAIRHAHPALQRNDTLEFLAVDNAQMLAFLKRSADGRDVIVTVVNLDPWNTQIGWLELPPELIDVGSEEPFQMHDLLGGQRFRWQGARHYIQLNPWEAPAHVMQLRRHVRTERDFDYFQ